MPKQNKRDNTTFSHKKALRRQVIQELAGLGVEMPVVMETHGGTGQLYRVCYHTFRQGVVFEKDAKKASTLGKQRPTWAVYECDCVQAIREGAGEHLEVTLLDVDPYGQCWDVIDAFFSSARAFAPVMAVVVNDGLRQSLGLGAAWDIRSMREMVEKYGNDLHPIYLEISEELIRLKAAQAGYQVDHFAGYYCGQSQQNTHWMAVLFQN